MHASTVAIRGHRDGGAALGDLSWFYRIADTESLRSVTVREPAARRKRRVLIGLVAVGAAIACDSMVFAAVSPMLDTPDEAAHVDDGYQVWHGELPNFFDGLHFEPGPGIKGFPVYLEAQHPRMLIALAAITASRQSPASISGPTTGAMSR